MQFVSLTLMRRWFFIILIPLVGCSEGEPKTTAAIPPIRLECHSAQHSDCVPQKAGKIAYVGLTINAVTCSSFLLAQTSNETLQKIFDAVGMTQVSVFGPFLSGTVINWVNFKNNTIYDLPKGEYTACSFIDLNGDARWTANEPLSTGKITPGSSETLLDIWY